MSAVAVIARAASLGVGLKVAGDKLRVKAPDGLPEDLRAGLIEHKPEIIEILGGPPEPDPIAWPPRPAELATWPFADRERWGRRADAMQDEGAGTKLDTIEALCKRDAEGTDLFDRVAQIDARPGARTDLVNNINEVRPQGTSAQRALRHLREAAPELHARVLADVSFTAPDCPAFAFDDSLAAVWPTAASLAAESPTPTPAAPAVPQSRSREPGPRLGSFGGY